MSQDNPAQATAVGTAPTAGETDPKLVIAAFHVFLREVTPSVRVVPAIVTINFLIFGLMVARGVSAVSPSAASLLGWGADYGPLTLGGQPWRVLSNVFLHFGILHVSLNMLALWNSGAVVERIFGRVAFAVAYFAAGVTGSLASLVVHPQTVSAGASGAVFGVYGALAAFLVRERGAIPAPVLSKLRGVALSFIAYNILYGLNSPQIDNAAHIGGLLGGAMAGALLARPLGPSRPVDGRRAAAVVAATVLLAVATLLLLPRPADFERTVAAFSAVEKTELSAYNQLVDDARNGLKDDDFATRLEREVLAPWHEARVRLATPQRWQPAQQQMIDLVLRYAEARDRGWRTLVDALRAHDQEGAKKANEQGAEATRLLDELNHWKPR
jgi:rhomboid protease GluP